MSTGETWTVGKLLTWTTEYLKKHGSPSSLLDAQVLLAHARGCQRIDLYTSFEEEPSSQVKDAFRDMVRRRAEGAPVAYLVGHKEFYSASFEVTPDVLIPRPETEHLVVEALDCAKQLRAARQTPEGSLRMADVGTGSGIIALTIAKHLPHCHVTAIDISPAALQVADRNAAKLELGPERVEFVQADLLTACEAGETFDMILSNPPYVSQSEFAGLEKSVREYEPQIALVAGPDGSEVIVRLLEQAALHLASDGWLIFEFSPMLAERLSTMVGPAWQSPRVIKDYAGHPRVVALQPTS